MSNDSPTRTSPTNQTGASSAATICSAAVSYYADERCTIYHGDSQALLLTVGEFDVVITDPPYGIESTSGGPNSRNRIKGNYSSAFPDTQEYVAEVCAQVVRKAIERAKAKRGAVTCGRTNMWHYPPARDVGALVSPRAVGVSYWGRPTWQPILFYGNAANAGEQLKPLHRLMMNAAPKNGHPCPKPIEAWRWLVGKASKEGETILDPFMGSGTTLVAAKLDGRNAVGIEIEERYCEIAANRLRQGTLF